MTEEQRLRKNAQQREAFANRTAEQRERKIASQRAPRIASCWIVERGRNDRTWYYWCTWERLSMLTEDDWIEVVW